MMMMMMIMNEDKDRDAERVPSGHARTKGALVCANAREVESIQTNQLGRFEGWIEWTRSYAKPGAQTTSITKEIRSAVDCRSPVSKPTHQRIIHIYINVWGKKKFRMHFLNTKKNITNLAHEKFYQ